MYTSNNLKLYYKNCGLVIWTKDILLFSLFIPSLCLSAQKTYVPDDNFEQALIDLGYDSGPLDDSVLTSIISGVTLLSIDSRNIDSLLGIEDFDNLTFLRCSRNNISKLDLRNNLKLERITCNENKLTSIDVSNNLDLIGLACYNNQLSTIDVSNNLILEELGCGFNNLTTLDLTNNPLLTTLGFQRNSVVSINLSNNPDLFSLNCSSNDITSLDLSSNLSLEYLRCNGNMIHNLNLSQNVKLVELECNSNLITSLDISNNTDLEVLQCFDNNLTWINLNMNLKLKTLYIGSSSLNLLDISKNDSLEILSVKGTMTSLNVENNTQLYFIAYVNSPLSSFPHGINKLTKLENLFLYNNQLSGCWPAELNVLCSRLTSYNFNGNNYNGTTDFISNQGWEDFCNDGTGGCCPSDLTESCPVRPCPVYSGLYQASNTITYSGDHLIGTMDSVVFSAGNSCTISSGFEVSSGSMFEMKIGGCN